LIFCGWGSYSPEELRRINELSTRSAIPIVADAASPFKHMPGQHIIRNAPAFFGLKSIQNALRPDLLLQFGAAPTSNSVLDFWASADTGKFCVHPLDHLDPSQSSEWIPATAASFLDIALQGLENRPVREFAFLQVDTLVDMGKTEFLSHCPWNSEPALYPLIYQSLPQDSALFLGNSSAVRDADLFSTENPGISRVIVNRGASGIDGLIASAAGCAAVSASPVFAVLGDLSFQYDISSLQSLASDVLPLCLIVLNNRGGGIFHRLPVADYPEQLQKYFITSPLMDISAVCSAFKIRHTKPRSPRHFTEALQRFSADPLPTVIEIDTDSRHSQELRSRFTLRIEQALQNISLP